MRGTGSRERDPGLLRFDLGAPEDSLEEISWEAWFAAFEGNRLALLRDPEGRFNQLIARER